jgi:hypothetical protein
MSRVAIGLDLSLTGSGIASSAGWCERVGTKDITKLPLADRHVAVDRLVDEIVILCRQADLVVVEVPAFSRAGGGVLERSALWWLVTRRLWLGEVPTAEAFNQHRMRYATGRPQADKGAIIDAVARRWPQFETGGDDNLADAAVLAAMGADWLGHPIADMPQTHRKALDAVRWPDALSPPESVCRPLAGAKDRPAAPEASQRPPSADAWAASNLAGA